jgi:ABC-type branched-subunit amino acid transport system substrate-binding protein
LTKPMPPMEYSVKKIRLVTVDTASKTEQASSAALRLINQDKVLAVLGEVASSRSLAAAPICQKAGVPMLSPASTNPMSPKPAITFFVPALSTRFRARSSRVSRRTS